MSEAITKNFALSFEPWTTDRKPVKTGKEFKLDFSSSSNINAPISLIAAHQKTQHIDPASTTNPRAKLPNNRFTNATFDNVSVKQYFVENDGILYHENHLTTSYPGIKYLNH